MTGHYSESYKILINSFPEFSENRFDAAFSACQKNHIEFLAIAILKLYDDTKNYLLGEHLRPYLIKLIPFLNPNHESLNFRLMSMIVKARLNNQFLRFTHLQEISLKDNCDGSIPDGKEGVSSQYHAYIVLLLIMWGDKNDSHVQSLINSGINWLLCVYNDYFDPSPIGRGRFQLFGYSSIFAILQHSSHMKNIPMCYIHNVMQKIAPENPNGSLSQRWSGPYRNLLLHEYNTPCDYIQFCRLWSEIVSFPGCSGSEASDHLIRFPLDFRGSSLVADSRGPVFALMDTSFSLPLDLGRKQDFLHSFHYSFRKTRYAENLSPEKILGPKFSLLDILFDIKKDRWCTLKFFKSPGSYTSPEIWFPNHFKMEVSSSQFEAEELTWCRSDSLRWHGLKVRLFDSAIIKILF